MHLASTDKGGSRGWKQYPCAASSSSVQIYAKPSSSGEVNVGGIVGYAYKSTLYNSYSSSSIYATISAKPSSGNKNFDGYNLYMGAIAGYMYECTFTSCSRSTSQKFYLNNVQKYWNSAFTDYGKC